MLFRSADALNAALVALKSLRAKDGKTDDIALADHDVQIAQAKHDVLEARRIVESLDKSATKPKRCCLHSGLAID